MLEEAAINDPIVDKSDGRLPREYFSMVRRRKGEILTVAVLIATLTTAVAIWLPPVYRSSATILVQEQEIPPDLVRSTITSYADERIQVISQQVMTRSVLLQLVQKYGLYPTLREHSSNDQIVERMRKDIKLSTVDASISDRSSGRRVNATIAFQISYDSPSADSAQNVVKDLVSLYLDENIKARQQSVAETTAFLTQEAERVAGQLRDIETNLAVFKRRYAGSLPESMTVNMQVAERTSAELQQVEREVGMAHDRRASLEAQMLLTRKRAADGEIADKGAATPDERLSALRARYTTAAAVYGPDHPDIRRMQREIAALEAQIGASGKGGDDAGQLKDLEARLATLKKQYSDDHPDVQRTSKSIAALRASNGQNVSGSKGPRAATTSSADASEFASNPAYVSLKAQLDSTAREIARLSALREDLRAKQHAYDARLLRIPEVEREYRDLSRDYDNAQTRYREIRAKQMQAAVAQELEMDRKAERFGLAEPANLPESPVSPNRMLIFALGLVGALGAGVGFAWIHEALDPSVKGPLDLRRFVPVPILTAIPYIETQQERMGHSRRRWMIACLCGAIASALLFAVHVHLRPLPVVVAGVIRRLTLW